MNLDLGRNNGKKVTVDGERLKNGHIGLIGVSGSGKTVQAHELICDILKGEGTVIALNIHGVLTDDQIMPWHKPVFDRYRYDINADEEGIPCPLFSPLTHNDGSREDELNLVENLTDIFANTILSGNASRQKEELRNAIQMVVETDAYKNEGIRALDDMLHYASNAVACTVREKLHAITSRNIFVYGDSLFKWKKLNIIHLSNYSADTQQVLAELLLEYIWRLANSGAFKDNPIYIFVDEFQNLPSGKGSALMKMLTEGRKFGISLILVTQVIPKTGKTDVMQFLTQCDTMLYFKPAADCVSQTAVMIDPSKRSHWCCFLNMLHISEFIATGPLLLDGRRCTAPLKVTSYTGVKPAKRKEIAAYKKNMRKEENTDGVIGKADE